MSLNDVDKDKWYWTITKSPIKVLYCRNLHQNLWQTYRKRPSTNQRKRSNNKGIYQHITNKNRKSTRNSRQSLRNHINSTNTNTNYNNSNQSCNNFNRNQRVDQSSNICGENIAMLKTEKWSIWGHWDHIKKWSMSDPW